MIPIRKNVILLLFGFSLLFYSCGPSSEEQRKQEIEDSLKLEQDRRELLERANKMMESDSVNEQKEATTEKEE